VRPPAAAVTPLARRRSLIFQGLSAFQRSCARGRAHSGKRFGAFKKKHSIVPIPLLNMSRIEPKNRR
jgi:hypothetical protein